MKYFGFAALLGIILFFSFIGGSSVFQVAEARNAECAREMYERKDLIVPTFNGELRTDKPILEYWGMIAAFWVAGVNEGSARFFSSLCGLLVVLATFLFVKKNLNLKAAWLSALVLLSSLHVIVQFRLATPDPYLILFHVLSLFFYWEGHSSGKWSWFLGMYISLALAVLSKGPVGLALPALSIFIFMVFTKKFSWKAIIDLKPWWGALIVLLITLPWYILVHIKTHGLWTEGFFLKHNVDRFSGPMDGHGGFFLVPFLFVIVGLVPFSVFLIGAVKSAWVSRKEDRFILFALISAATIIVFYAFSGTKLINYTAPSYPFVAIVVGAYLAKIVDGRAFRLNVRPEIYTIAVVGFAMPIGAYLFTKYTEPFDSVSWMFIFFLALPLGALVAIWLQKRSICHAILSIAASFLLTNFLFFAFTFQIIDDQSPVSKHKELVHSYDHVVAYRNFDHAFAFYAKKTIPIIHNVDDLMSYVSENENVLILGRDRDLSYMDSIPNLRTISVDRDLFSRRYSGFYVLEKK